VSEICFDSRQIKPHVLFVAIKGTTLDGHQFIDQAVAQGAKAVLCENLPAKLDEHVCYLQVENAAKALGTLAANFHDHPSSKLKLVGVTGTNGKTTIATLLFQLFRGLGYKIGLLSTVQNQINEQVIPATHTTPDPIALNGLINDMVDAGCDYCFMEVSSHAVAQYRIEGFCFAGGIFTNLTHDHLDFHKTFDVYLKAKKAFFDGLNKSAFALTNVDDKNGMVMLQNTKAKPYTYGLTKMADYKGVVLENELTGLLLKINQYEVHSQLIGKFNASNLLAVFGVANLLGFQELEVLQAMSSLQSVDGRFQFFTSTEKVTVVVDYAHTPDALENVLKTIALFHK
jgi:UDP-N-acetylmuramoyl-L-alanyl-D-glutamate--2,6-diaminopimelate ligase